MNKIFFKVLFLFILTSCLYEPILTNKKNDFRYDNIYFEGEKEINKIIVKNLRKTNNSQTKYDLFFKTKKTRDIVSLDKKGDPSIFSVKINLEYEITQVGKKLLNNKIEKKITYNNIDDKFELSIKEKKVLNYLSKNLSDEILRSTLAINK